MIGLLKGMKINYLTIIIASLIKAIFVLNLCKKQLLVPIMTKNDWFIKRYEN
jgi:hypothetical protein